MEPIEMIERVCKSTNVTFEEAREALEANNWDLVETFIALEREGKKIMYTEESVKIEDTMEVVELDNVKEEKISGYKGFFHKVLDFLRTNSIRVEKNDNEVLTVKLFVFLIALLFASNILLPLMFVGLFFNFKYSFVGKNQMDQVNNIMNSVSCAASAAKAEIQKSL